MNTIKLDKSEWAPFFDRISKRLQGKRAEIEVASLELGDQIEASWLPLLGITYDPKADMIEVGLEGFDHLIKKPREAFLAQGVGELTAIEIVDADGVRQIVKLKDPLLLQAPGH